MNRMQGICQVLLVRGESMQSRKLPKCVPSRSLQCGRRLLLRSLRE